MCSMASSSHSMLIRRIYCVLLYTWIQQVNLSLDFYRFRQRSYDAAVVLDVLHAEEALLAVFEPFVEHLIAADLILPNFGLDALKILRIVDVNPLFLLIVCLFLNTVAAFSLEAANGLVEFGGL